MNEYEDAFRLITQLVIMMVPDLSLSLVFSMGSGGGVVASCSRGDHVFSSGLLQVKVY
jgi:hypothetical protein